MFKPTAQNQRQSTSSKTERTTPDAVAPSTPSADANQESTPGANMPNPSGSTDKSDQLPKIPPRFYAYVGGGSQQVGVYRFDAGNGSLTPVQNLAVAQASPTFLAIHPKRTALYAANESAGGGVIAFSINRDTGELTRLNEMPMNIFGPTHVAVDPSGRFVMGAGYNTGRVVSWNLQADGRIGSQVSDLAAGQNAHQALPGPKGGDVFVPCLGENYIAQYRLDAQSGVLSAHATRTVPTGEGGPRHMVFHPNGRWAYVLNELNSTVLFLQYDAASQSLSLPPAPLNTPVPTLGQVVNGNSAAEVQVHPSGKWLYASNRGDDSIAHFQIGANGGLTRIGTTKTGGARPRHFSIDPTGRWLLAANQDSGRVTVLSIDGNTGALSATNQGVAFSSPQFVEVVNLVEGL